MRSRIAALVCALMSISAPVVSSARALSPTPGFTSTILAGAGAEPNISISPSGKTVLVSGLGGTSPATLYRSTNYGVTFTKITPAFTKSGGGDWDMRFLDEKTIVAADLAGGSIYIHRSTDSGSTWTTAQVLGDVYDRPWIEHYGKDNVYLTAKGFDGVPYLYRSVDGGKSFGNPIPIPALVYGTGALPAEAGGTDPTMPEGLLGGENAYVDHMSVDPRDGTVFVLYGIGSATTFGTSRPLGVSNRLYVARLYGATMVSKAVHLGGPTESFISGFNWMTVDKTGTLYVLANGSIGGHHSTYLSYSKDQASTWSKLVDLGAKGAANVYGAIASGGPGQLSMMYLRGTNEDPSKAQSWYAESAHITGADTAKPAVYRIRSLAKAIHTQDICFDGILCGQPGFGKNRDLLDYIWCAVSSDGRQYGVFTSDGPFTGSKGASVVVVRQDSGALLGAGAPS